jgi:4-amino-4-deoxy-L-arabinose transferase-like glycosyltransferase
MTGDPTTGPEATGRKRRREWQGWGAALALAGMIFASLLALASRTTLWDRDEPRFAQATVEMIASGDYLVPTFNGRLRPDKPILAYWWMALPMRLLGPSAVAARLGSAAAMAIAALLTFAAARRLLPAGTGTWAMAALAATPLAVAEGQAATADALLLAAVTGALACFAVALTGDGRRAWPWLGLGVALGLAQLAKGPVGLAVPGLGIATTLAILARQARAGREVEQARQARPGREMEQTRQARQERKTRQTWQEDETAGGPEANAAAAATTREAKAVPIGRYARRAALAALLGVAIFCAWGVPANLATGGELARVGIGKHVVGRALGAMEGHGGGGGHGWRGWVAGLPFYLAVVWLGFAPWVPWLPAAVSATLGGRLGGERGRALLIGWTVPTFALMTLVATRLPHYVLPAWPALALAVGGTLEAERRGELAPRDRRWLRRGAWLLGPLVGLAFAAVAALAVLAVFGRHPAPATGLAPVPAAASAGGPPAGTSPAPGGFPGPIAGASLADVATGLALPCLALAAILAVAGGRALRDHLAGRYRRAATMLLGGALAAALVAGGAVAPALERLKPAPRLAAAVRAATAPGVPVATFGYAEPSFTFYLGRWPVRELRDAAAVAAWAAEGGPGVLVLPRSAAQSLGPELRAAGTSEIAAAGGWNVAKGKPLELIALLRGPRQAAGTAAAGPAGRGGRRGDDLRQREANR